MNHGDDDDYYCYLYHHHHDDYNDGCQQCLDWLRCWLYAICFDGWLFACGVDMIDIDVFSRIPFSAKGWWSFFGQLDWSTSRRGIHNFRNYLLLLLHESAVNNTNTNNDDLWSAPSSTLKWERSARRFTGKKHGHAGTHTRAHTHTHTPTAAGTNT